MKIEFLVSTMNRKDLSFLDAMFQHNNISNINVLVINQCINIEIPTIETLHENVRVISVKDKGLSKSRNLGLRNAIGDIVLPTDDDVVYEPDIVGILTNAFESNKDVDLLTFQIRKKSGGFLKKYRDHAYNHTMRSILQVASVEIALRRNEIARYDVVYNEFFGLGATYPTGEENIFLKELLKKKVRMRFVPYTIASHPDMTSGALLDRRGLFNKGAVFANLWGIMAFPAAILFVIKKRNLLKDISFCLAVFSSLNGVVNYLKIK